MPVDEEIYIRRFEDEDEFRTYVESILSRMIEIRNSTHPNKVEASAFGKTHAAFTTLMIMNKLSDAVAGWAIDHYVGLAMDGLTFLSPASAGGNLNSTFREYLRKADVHIHEINGSVQRTKFTLNERNKRLLTAALLHANPGAFPAALCYDLRDAIEALDFQELKPIFKTTIKNRHVNRSELNLQLKAICFVYYWAESGMKVGDAYREVAEAFGLSEETVRSWKRRVRKDLGNLHCDEAIRQAKVDAELNQAYEAGNLELAEEGPNMWGESWSAASLQETAAEFHRLARKKG